MKTVGPDGLIGPDSVTAGSLTFNAQLRTCWYRKTRRRDTAASRWSAVCAPQCDTQGYSFSYRPTSTLIVQLPELKSGADKPDQKVVAANKRSRDDICTMSVRYTHAAVETVRGALSELS